MSEDHAIIVRAKKMQTDLKGAQESKYLLKKAVSVAESTREFGDLEAALKKAQDTGADEQSEDFKSANTLLAALKKEVAVRANLKEATASRDAAKLEAALEEVKATGLKGSADLVAEARATLARIHSEAEVLKELREAVGTKNAPKLQAALAKASNLWPSTEGVPEVAAEIEKGAALLQTLGSKNTAMDAVTAAMDAAQTSCGVSELKMLTTTLQAAAEAGSGSDEQYAKAKDLEGILTQRLQAEADLRNVMASPGDDSEQKLEQGLAAAAALGLSVQNSETVRQARGALQMLQRRSSVAPLFLQKGENPTQALSDAVAAKDPDAISLAIMLVLRKGTDVSDPKVVQAKLVMDNLVEAKEVEAQLQAIVSTFSAGRAVSSETQSALVSALKRAEAASMDAPVISEARAVLEKGEKSSTVMDKLKAAIKSRHMTQLDNAITAATELGVPASNFQLTTARSLLQSVYVSTKLDTDLEEAINTENLNALQKLVVEATKMGLSNDHPKVKQARTMAESLLARQKVSIQVTSSLNSQNQDLMQAALAKADQVGLKTQTVTQLRQLVSGAGDIDQLLKNLAKAVETRDLTTLTRLYAEAEELGLHDDIVTDALVTKERLELVQQLTANLEQATVSVQSSPTRANHHELMELVARAMQCNLQSPFLQVARSAAEKAEKQLEAFEGVHAAVVASQLACSRVSGIIARDVSHLQAAIQSVGSAEFADALKEPNALLEQMQKQLAVQKALAEGINSQEMAQLQSALQAASQIGLEITAVHEARRAIASLEGVRAKGKGVLAELKRAKPNAEVAEEWKKKLQIADQMQFHFSKYDQIRVPADFVIGVKKNRKRVQMQMLSFQSEPLHKSITFLESELNLQARNVHRNILGFCSDLIMSFPLTLAVDLLSKGLEVPDMCDEIYAQLCKHLTSNPTAKSTLRGWQLMCFCLHTFPPSASFEVYLLNFLLTNEKDTKQGSTKVLKALRSNAGISGLVEYCLKKMEVIVRDGPVDTVPNADQLDGLLPKKVQKAIRRGSMLVRQKQQEAYVVEEEVKLATNVVGAERAESVQKELEEARGIFRTLLATDKTHRTLHFDQILHCPDVAQQIAKSDLSIDAVKALWDMACVDPASGGNAMISLGDRVGFVGFLRFLDLCEQDGDVGVARTHALAGRFGEGLAALKTSLLPNLRSTLTKYHRVQSGAEIKGCGPPVNDLDKQMHRALLGRSLQTRQDQDTLKQRGILKNLSNKGAALDAKMKKMMLGKALAGRPERASLTAQGILQNQSATQNTLQKNLRKSMLGQALSNRPERESLEAQGIVLDASPAKKELEKNLNANMLNRRFSQRPALEQLEQLGIYRNATSEKIDMERQLISSQLNKTLGRRLSKQVDAEAGDEKKVMEEDILAIVFEQLADNTSLLGLSKLQAWDEVQSQMRSKKISEGELSKCFHDCDSDKDGKITFSEFLLLLKALEERQQAKAPPARRKSLMSIKRRGTLLENAASVGRCESLKGVLLKKMASRPEVEQLRNQGIYKAGNRSPATVLLERNLLANKLKASLADRTSRDKLVDQGVLKTDSPAKLNMEKNMQKAVIGRSLANRPSMEVLQAQGIIKEQDARQQKMEKNIARSMLGKRLSVRPDLQQLQNQGIYHKTSDAKIQLERSLITSQLSRALTRRPSREALKGKGILEEDEFALMFKSICDDQELLSLALLSEWEVVKEQLSDGSLNHEILGRAFAEVDSDADGSIDFSQFLALLELTELLQKQQTEDREDSPAEKLRKRRQYRQRKQEDKAKGGGVLNEQATLKSSLLSKIKHRPTMDMLQAKGIMSGQSPAAQLLERNLISSSLKQKMESRRDQATLEQLGILKSSSSRMEQMEHNMKKTMLGKALSKRSSKVELESQGIYMEGTAVSLGLERNVQKGMLARRLSNRPDKEQLQNLGIYQTGSVVSRNLEQGLLQRRLSSALDSRPEKEQLVNQGIYMNQTSSQIGMQQSMSKMLLNRRLSNRPDVQELQNLGIYKAEGPGGRGASLERNLKSSMLARQLGTRLELEQLQNMGIYKEMETAPTEEDRKVIENQLNSSLGNRRSKEAMEAAGILKADTSSKSMALERNLISSQLSRALGKSSRKTHADLKLSGIIPDALAIGFKEICSDDETATLEQLKTMKGFNESLSEGGISEDQLSLIFAQADSDGDGLINFSQFMILTDQVEVVKETQGTSAPAEDAGDSSRAALGSLLSKRIGARPSVMDMMSMGVMKKEKSPAAAMLERNLVVNQLKNNLARRNSKENLVQQGILQQMSGAQKEIEQEAHKQMLDRALGRRPSKETLVSQGILSTSSSTQTALERNLLKNALKNQLKVRRCDTRCRAPLSKNCSSSLFQSRPSIQELGNQGIYQASASNEYVASLDQILAVSMCFEVRRTILFAERLSISRLFASICSVRVPSSSRSLVSSRLQVCRSLSTGPRALGPWAALGLPLGCFQRAIHCHVPAENGINCIKSTKPTGPGVTGL
jgi:Ca2+-binding EF-hand superfamily protein